MSDFDIDPEEILAFRVGDEYLFSHYFDRDTVFEELEEYYNRDDYRFEIPAEDFEDVCDRLEEEYYSLKRVEDLEPYCVVKEQYTPHADILRNSVAKWERRGYNFFLMKDELSVSKALEDGATKITETNLAIGL